MSIQREAAHADLQGHKKPCYRQFLKFGLLFDFMWTNAIIGICFFVFRLRYSILGVAKKKKHPLQMSAQKNYI